MRMLPNLGLWGKRRNSSRRVHRFTSSKDCKHNPWTQFPKDSNLDICREAKSSRAQCRSKNRGKPDEFPKPLKITDSITADHKILNEDDASRENDRVAMIILDRFTRWLQGYACKGKSASECLKFFKCFLGPQCKPEHVYPP